MNLIIRKYTRTNVYRAYFDEMPKFYGEGLTREDAISQLVEKMQAVLAAISNIQKGKL